MSSARPVVKSSTMPGAMQEFAIIAAQEAIAAFATEQEIASSIKAKFEQQYPAVYVHVANFTWHLSSTLVC